MYEISEEKTERDETQKFSKHDKKKKIKPEIQQSPGNPSNINTKKIIDKHG